MADGLVSVAFSYVGWAFLPSFVTGLLQNLYYRVTIRAGQRHPQPGESLYAYHHRRLRLLVLVLYLVYTLVQTLYDVKLGGDFYTILGVTPFSSDREIKARFRRLAAKYHPDKARELGHNTASAEAIFVHLKLAHDTILDPARKFAYDRFGPVVVRVQHPGLKTIRDYVYAGLRAKVPEYASSILMLIALNYIWLPKWGQFWRYLAVAGIAVLEIYFLTHTWIPHSYIMQGASIIQRLSPNLVPTHLLPFQIMAIARRMSMSINIFISQLAPPAARNQADQNIQMQHHLTHLSQGASRLDNEAGSLLQLGLSPFKGDGEKIRALRASMKEAIMMSAVRGNPEVQAAVRQVVERKNGGGG